MRKPLDDENTPKEILDKEAEAQDRLHKEFMERRDASKQYTDTNYLSIEGKN